jgi:hypothetical protein
LPGLAEVVPAGEPELASFAATIDRERLAASLAATLLPAPEPSTSS